MTTLVVVRRRTMASQPSIYNEERNRLRLRAWEQRNQETSQAKELNSENVPLFGVPYKTNKGDELSNRIQRMLGSYEDVNNPYPYAIEPLPIPSCGTFSQSDQGLPNTDKPTKPPFHNQIHYMSTQSQKAPSSNGYSSQPVRTSAASSSPNHLGHSSTFSDASLNHSQLSLSARQQKRSEALSDLRECVSPYQEMSSQSPDAKQLPFPHSSDHDKNDKDTKDMDASNFNLKQSPNDASLPQANKGNALPSQTFPSLLSSKQPSVVMTQKPTAYVRPMDGQDQVVSESPELKSSPEPYVPLPELINKSDLGKTKILPQFMETRSNEVLSVEDILREMTHSWPPLLTAIQTPSTDEPSKALFQAKEMTHSWPPLLTAIQTPSTDEPSKALFQAKEAEHVSSCPGQNPSQLIQQSSSASFEAAHSREVESASSSDSESSSRSESESESTIEEPPQLPVSSSNVKNEPEAPAVSHGNWQLGNWIRSSQQNSGTESQSGAHAPESPAHKQPLPTQSSKLSLSVEVVDPTRESKPKLSTHQREFTDRLAKLQQHSKSPQDNYNHQSNQKSPFGDLNSCSSSRKLPFNKNTSIPEKAGCKDRTEAAIDVKCEEVVATQDKDPCFKDRPKVKTKTGHGKKSKDNRDTKRDSKRTSKHTSLDKRKAGEEPEAPVVVCGHCPSCGVQYPIPCSCPIQGPAQPHQLSPAPLHRLSSSKQKSETICQRGNKIPHKTTHKKSEKAGQIAKSSQDPHRPSRSLLVKIDLRLLSRVPLTPGNHQEIPSIAKRSALVIEQDGGGKDASSTHKLAKTSTKSISQNVEVDNATLPRKKQRLENKNTSSNHVSVKLERSCNSKDDRERKKAKKKPVSLQQPLTPKDPAKGPKVHKRSSVETQESSKEAVKSKHSSTKHKKSSGKHTENPHFQKKPPKSSLKIPPSSQPTREALSNRPLYRLEERQYPVKHYIKEAKKLKHKADAESDKLSKAFNYLDAAMYFVESGIAMEKDPHISMSSYTMFAETVELLKFVLKLKNSVDATASPSEKDFLSLCLKCQSLLQMTMFRHKQKTALKYSKTLTDHFSNSTTPDPSVVTLKGTDTPSYIPNMPSPANTSTSSGPASNHSVSGLVVDPVGTTVVIPQAIGQVAFTYVNITMLLLSAHDIWEQAEELAQRGSGMLTELDTVMGPLSLSSSMRSLVSYTRQGVHWLRLDSQKVK
ncbi:AF4/FMR2 family member 1 isoform X2 [Anoplopoma fimbria]|uniref:AF4/FMR2 family member 1 isoform X2 n=1 Tax=Anoplopoma fimbria TaxID=229290 RepID=UPI0023EDEDC2|nr:AF4/FMR2 family member 1 isoform X2 [Anoplopoma fimbria]